MAVTHLTPVSSNWAHVSPQYNKENKMTTMMYPYSIQYNSFSSVCVPDSFIQLSTTFPQVADKHIPFANMTYIHVL